MIFYFSLTGRLALTGGRNSLAFAVGIIPNGWIWVRKWLQTIEAGFFVTLWRFHRILHTLCGQVSAHRGFFLLGAGGRNTRPQIFWTCPFMTSSIFIDFGMPTGLLYRFLFFIADFKSGRLCQQLLIRPLSQWRNCEFSISRLIWDFWSTIVYWKTSVRSHE